MEILIREPCICGTVTICTTCWGTGYIEKWTPISKILKTNKRKLKNENRNRKKTNSN